MADKAYITPKVLQWARESARMSLETASAKVSIAPEKLIEWEDGSGQPTIKQAETLAKAYKRPFAIFFLPEAPRDFTPLQDFRKKTAKPLGTASVFIIREIQQKQAWIRDVFENNNESVLPFVGRFSIQDNPVKVANDILDTLQINKNNYSVYGPINEWIDKAESRGIFISKTSFIHTRLKLDSEEMQGFAIADSYAPFIFINSEDWNTSQFFTLVHELSKMSKKLGVSSFAFLFRAFKLQIISIDKYRKLKILADSAYKAFLQREDEKKAKQKKQERGPNPYLLRLNKNSRLFTQIVLDAFRGGFVEPTLASSLLNTQINKFSKLEAFL